MGHFARILGFAAALVLMCGSVRAAEPPFRGALPESGKWAIACFCYGEECPQLDPVTEACVVYHAKQISKTERAVFFLMKGMRTGLGVKYALGVRLTSDVQKSARGEIEIGGEIIPLQSCSDNLCFTPATDAQIAAAGSPAGVKARLYSASHESPFFAETFIGPGSEALAAHLIKLPQHP